MKLLLLSHSGWNSGVTVASLVEDQLGHAHSHRGKKQSVKIEIRL